MRLLILAMILALASPHASAVECKIRDVKDRGRETKKTFLVRRGTKALAYTFGHDDGALYLWVQYARHFSGKLLLDESTPLTVVLDDGAEVTFTPILEAKSKHEGPIVTGSKLVRLRYAVSEEQLRAVTGKTVRTVRISFRERGGEPQADEHEVNDDDGIEFGEAAACLRADRGEG